MEQDALEPEAAVALISPARPLRPAKGKGTARQSLFLHSIFKKKSYKRLPDKDFNMKSI